MTSKAIATARVEHPAQQSQELARWFSLHVMVSSGGILLAMLAGGAYVYTMGRADDSLQLYSLLAVSSWLAIAATFIRVALTSLLSFARVTVMDTVESVLRSASWVGVLILAGDIALALIPGHTNAVAMFEILSALFIACSLSDLFVPASDYVGGLGKRIVFLSSCAVLQLPLIWLAAVWDADLGAVIAVALSYVLMATGYMLIAKDVFFRSSPVNLPRDIPPRYRW